MSLMPNQNQNQNRFYCQVGFHIQRIFFWCFWCKFKYREYRKGRKNLFTINIVKKYYYKNTKYNKFTICHSKWQKKERAMCI